MNAILPPRKPELPARPGRLTRWTPGASGLMALMLLPALAWAAPVTTAPDSPEDAPKSRKAKDETEGDHWEFTFGFLAGQRDYSDTNFAYGEGEGSQGLAEPFERAPFNALDVVGLRWEVRAVLNHVRMTVGYDLPFSNFSAHATKGIYEVNGKKIEVIPQSVNPHELRFGLGAEQQLGPVTPFVDLMGAMTWSDTDMSADGKSVVYRTNSFAYTVRGGLRYYLREFFFLTACGEYGFFGNVRWNAELSAGFHFG